MARGAGRGQRADAGQRLLPRHHPVVEQHRVVHQEGRHAEPGGVADAEPAPQAGLEHRRARPAADAGQVLDKVQR